MNKAQTYTIPVIVRTQDNGDGGYSIYAYNSEQELLNDHHLYEDASEEEKEQVAADILNEDDPYNGYISHENIEIEIIDGVAKLVGSLHFHAGQWLMTFFINDKKFTCDGTYCGNVTIRDERTGEKQEIPLSEMLVFVADLVNELKGLPMTEKNMADYFEVKFKDKF